MKPSKLLVALLLFSAASIAPAQHSSEHKYTLEQDTEGWVYMDEHQRPVLRPYFFDNGPDYFEEGLARFVQDGKIGFHDEALNIVIPAKYDFAYPFKDGKTQAGMNCSKHMHGEHSSMQCEQWMTVLKPER